MLLEEIESHRSLDSNQIPPPLEHFQRYIEELNIDSDLSDKSLAISSAVKFCTRDIYHYARVSGQHVLECVMDTALSAVKREQLQEASNVCVQFYL